MNTTTIDTSSKVLFIGGSHRSESYVRALETAGYSCEHTVSPDSGMARLRDPDKAYDLVIWDTELQARELDEAFDKGVSGLDVMSGGGHSNRVHPHVAVR